MSAEDMTGATQHVPHPPISTSSQVVKHRRVWSLIALELLIALSAVYGGVGLIWNNAIQMPSEWLEGTPFRSWVLPGVLLLLVVALPMGLAAVLELRASPWAAIGSLVAGAAQVAWIAAELLIMQRYSVLQPVMIGFGLAVLLLGVWVHRDQPLLPSAATPIGR